MHRPQARIVLLILIAISLSACKPKGTPQPVADAPPQSTPTPAHKSPPHGIRAGTAGDLCVVADIYLDRMPQPNDPPDGIELKLRGIDCPDLNEPGGPEARAFVEGFLATKSAWIEAKWYPKWEPASSHIDVFRDPDRAHLNAELVRYGHARVTAEVLPEHAELLQKLEAQARALKLGIWN